MNNFVAGDQVRLKSGGPVMTVESSGPGTVTCTWFYDGMPVRTREVFMPETLEKLGGLEHLPSTI